MPANSRPVKTQAKIAKLSLNTAIRPELQRNSQILSGATTSKSSKMPGRVEERTTTHIGKKESKIQFDQEYVLQESEYDKLTLNPARLTSKADDYKMQILENNKKILKFESQKDKVGSALQKGSKLVSPTPGHQPLKQSLTSNKDTN